MPLSNSIDTQKGELDMSCRKHRDLEEALKTERYKDFKPTSDKERLQTDAFGKTQADLVAKIRREEGEEYYQRNKHWLWSKLAWDDYMNAAR